MRSCAKFVEKTVFFVERDWLLAKAINHSHVCWFYTAKDLFGFFIFISFFHVEQNLTLTNSIKCFWINQNYELLQVNTLLQFW
jgi:hypothetical protein